MGLITNVFKVAVFASIVLMAGQMPLKGKPINDHVAGIMSGFQIMNALRTLSSTFKVRDDVKSNPEFSQTERARLNSLLRSTSRR